MQSSRRKLIVGVIFASGVIFLIAGVVLTRVIPAPVKTDTPTPGSMDQVQRISVEDAKAALDAGSAVFLDVRDEDSYTRTHISGAGSMPLGSLPTRVSELDPTTWIIPYCT